MTTEAAEEAVTVGHKTVARAEIDKIKQGMRRRGRGELATDENAWLVAVDFAGTDGRCVLTNDPRNTPWGEALRARRVGERRRLVLVGKNDGLTHFTQGSGKTELDRVLAEYKIGQNDVSSVLSLQALWSGFFGRSNFFTAGDLPAVLVTTGKLLIRRRDDSKYDIDCAVELKAIADSWDIPLVVLPFTGH